MLRKGGAKYRSLKYHLANGRRRWATIGRHGSPWTVETVRKQAQRLVGQIADGADAVEAKAIERQDVALSQFSGRYLAQPIVITNRGTAKKASPLAMDRSNSERHIRPLLGQMRLGSPSRVEVEKFQRSSGALRS